MDGEIILRGKINLFLLLEEILRLKMKEDNKSIN
jgi:hypothetical protein